MSPPVHLARIGSLAARLFVAVASDELLAGKVHRRLALGEQAHPFASE